MLGVKIHYLFNSSFSVETAHHLLILDYFRDNVSRGEKTLSNGAIGPNDLSPGKRIYVFASHNHGDHFDPVIFQWLKTRNDITYILSSDISTKPSTNIIRMSTNDTIDIDNISIKALGTTDIGVSFLIDVDGVCLFHAGDLNWWYWWDDTPKEIETMENGFKKEIAKLNGKKVDIAFFPVDPRLKDNYCLGGEHFIKEIRPSYFLPMHFGNKYSVTRIFAEKMKPYPTKVLEISRRGQEFIL